MDWNDCKQKKLAKKITSDPELIKSLIHSSTNKNASQKTLVLTEITAVSKVSLAYDAVREKLEALAVKNGWKIYNHECYCSFLKEIINESELADMFDLLRKVRNDLNYYGKNISVADATARIEELETVLKKVEKLLEK